VSWGAALVCERDEVGFAAAAEAEQARAGGEEQQEGVARVIQQFGDHGASVASW